MKIYKLLLVFLIATSCKKEVAVVLPECLLTEEQMIDAMVEVTILKSTKTLGRQGLKDSGIQPLEYLFAKHGVDTVVIRENFEYYNNDLGRAKELYGKIILEIERRELIVKNEIDSIRLSKDKKEEELNEREHNTGERDQDEDSEDESTNEN